MTATLVEELELSTWTIARLEEYVGGLSTPSKMPGYAYGLPAAECKTGGRLQRVAGSTCSGCYALKGMYRFPGTKRAMYRRLEALDKPLWVPAMAELLNRRSGTQRYHRWHDSGDLQSVDHLRQIVEVCELTPQIRHWLPTREYRTVALFVAAGGVIPPNLNIRMSAHMIGGQVPTFPRLAGLVTVSTVSTDGYEGAHDCPSRFQDNSCGDCRACWDRGTAHVDYHLH